MRAFFLYLFIAGSAACGSAVPPSPPAPTAVAADSSRADPRFSGGDGSTCERAVVIHEGNEQAGIKAERDWISQHYPGGRKRMQALGGSGGTFYDTITLVKADGTEVSVCFNITAFFARF